MSHRPSTALSICRRCISICYRNALTLANRALRVCNEDPGICHQWAFKRYERHPCAIFTNAMCLPLRAHNRPCACCRYSICYQCAIIALSVGYYHPTNAAIIPPSWRRPYACYRYTNDILAMCYRYASDRNAAFSAVCHRYASCATGTQSI